MGKLIGGIFLIVGISIGAGVLALPVTTASSGFISSSIFFVLCWAFMCFNAFLMLEVNLWLPENSNMISMAKATLGKPGQIIAWFSYCLLLYSLLAAYISAGSDVLDGILKLLHIQFPSILDSVMFASLLGFVVYRGTKSIDFVNRGLIITKLLTFVLIIYLVGHHIQISNLTQGHTQNIPSTLMVMITSFGFASIVPSIRSYFKSDIQQLRIVLIVGSLIPLICYIFWILVILGSLPLEGKNGLQQILASGKTTSNLILALSNVIKSPVVTSLSAIFSAICVATSFLGVALSLSDFLFDGLQVSKKGYGNCVIYSLTFIPPLMVVILYPAAFISALGYAGTCCVILLGLLPVCMVWRGRYVKKIASGFRVPGGKAALITSFALVILVLSVGLCQEVHFIRWLF